MGQGSRIKPSPSSLLVCWCEVVAGNGPNQPPWIIQKFPNTFDDKDTLKSIPEFVFPCKIEITAVQNFSFVLTGSDSSFTFGFCRHSPQSESALVILSYLPWDSTFYKILHQCHELHTSNSPEDVWAFLQALLSVAVPDPGTDLVLTYPPHNKTFVVRCPNHLALPSIPDNRNLMEYMNAASSETMLVVFASMLFERRILVSSRNMQRLSACVQAANSLIFPMSWQHIYIPIMPPSMLDYALAPMPYLIGVPDGLMKMVHLDEVGEVVYLNADTDTVETPFRDVAEMPNEVVSSLRRRLNQPAQGMGDYVPRAFMRALVMLIGNYRDCLQFKQEERKVSFNMEKFVSSRPLHMQPFATKMLDLQIFQQFLQERLEMVNRGEATTDDFEMEVSVYSDKPRKNYQHFVKNMKKEGGAIVKNFKSKTNPAVKSAVKSVSKGGKQVKELGQEKYKEFKGKIRLPSNRSPEHTSYNNDREPRSAPSSPTSPRRLPHPAGGGPVTAKASYTRNSAGVHRPARSSQRDSSVPPSISASSFRSPDSPGHTPAPHTIDLVGELEQELFSRLSEPSSLTPRHSLTSPFPSTTLPTSTSSSQRGPGSRADIPRPTALPPPIPNTRANTTLGTTRTREASPSRQTLSATSKDQDLILLGSPQEEEFDPLLTKQLDAPSSLPPPPPSLDPLPPPRRHGPHNPVPSFLHSQPVPSSSSLLASIYQPYHPSYSSSASASSVSPGGQPNPPSSGPPAAMSRPRSSLPMPPLPPAGDAAPSLPAPARRTSSSNAFTQGSSSSNHRGFPAASSTSSAAQVLASRPASTAAHGLGGGGGGTAANSIPTSTMAALPTALQHHLAAKIQNKNTRPAYGTGRPLDSSSSSGEATLAAPVRANHSPAAPTVASVVSNMNNSSAAAVPVRPTSQQPNHRHQQVAPSTASGGDNLPQALKTNSVFNDPRFVPFSSLQATSTSPPTMQANPMYNMHQIPVPAKVNLGPTANNKPLNSSETNGKTTSTTKPNLALAFANSMLGSSGANNDNNSTGVVEQPANNNTIESKMLGDLSEPFSQMKLNAAAVAGGAAGQPVDAVAASAANRQWTAFE